MAGLLRSVGRGARRRFGGVRLQERGVRQGEIVRLLLLGQLPDSDVARFQATEEKNESRGRITAKNVGPAQTGRNCRDNANQYNCPSCLGDLPSRASSSRVRPAGVEAVPLLVADLRDAAGLPPLRSSS